MRGKWRARRDSHARPSVLGRLGEAEEDKRPQAGEILGPALRCFCNRTAARNTLASCPRSAVNCNPRGSPLAIGMGIDMAGVPKAVQGAFILGSPVLDKPKGAGPVAAGVRITGVDLKISAIRTRLSARYRLASSYRSAR